MKGTNVPSTLTSMFRNMLFWRTSCARDFFLVRPQKRSFKINFCLFNYYYYYYYYSINHLISLWLAGCQEAMYALNCLTLPYSQEGIMAPLCESLIEFCKIYVYLYLNFISINNAEIQAIKNIWTNRKNRLKSSWIMIQKLWESR